jgi:hypothetical protein
MKGDRWGRISAIDNRCSSTQMVEVGMGEPDMADMPAASVSFSHDNVSIPGWIDYRGLTAFGICDQVCIGLNGPEDERYDG